MAWGTGSAINNTQTKNVYPAAMGASLGQIGGISTVSGNTSPAASNADATQASTGVAVASSGGTSALFYIALVGLLVALMWFSQHYGSEGKQFADLRLTIYNIVVIGLAATLFLVTGKTLLAKFPVKGLSQVMLAA